jgi:hypothetical protein
MPEERSEIGVRREVQMLVPETRGDIREVQERVIVMVRRGVECDADHVDSSLTQA